MTQAELARWRVRNENAASPGELITYGSRMLDVVICRGAGQLMLSRTYFIDGESVIMVCDGEHMDTSDFEHNLRNMSDVRRYVTWD